MTDDGACSIAPSSAVLDTFESRLREIWRRGSFEIPDVDGTARLVRILLEREGFAATAAVLARAGIRAAWNREFARNRSTFLAQWLLPYLSGRVLDVLGGDFTVLRALVDAGLPLPDVAGCERRGAYDVDWSALPFAVDDYGFEHALPAGAFDTYVISTVLHHEPDPEGFLDLLRTGTAHRWVVVENCLDEANTSAFHLYVDEFFNNCLNRFDVRCVPEHRTADDWRTLFAGVGRVTYEETRRDVPGIPFPYTVFVVDR